jgi:hypothetical protein
MRMPQLDIWTQNRFSLTLSFKTASKALGSVVLGAASLWRAQTPSTAQLPSCLYPAGGLAMLS